MAHELQRLHNSSLERVLLQLWPSARLVFFAVVSMLEERRSQQRAGLP
ncbi:MAG: hypothetical protein ACREOC_09285 [Gemmatimonadales bacterium]